MTKVNKTTNDIDKIIHDSGSVFAKRDKVHFFKRKALIDYITKNNRSLEDMSNFIEEVKVK